MKLSYTRAMLKAAFDGSLDEVSYTSHDVFGIAMPNSCPDVPGEILHPRNTWSSPEEYDAAAMKLQSRFLENYASINEGASDA